MFNHLTSIDPIQLKSIEGPKGRFYVTPEGNKYPSITTMLGHSGDKSWLNDWRSSLGEVRADRETKRAADRGSAVHLMVERYLQNHEDPTAEQMFEHVNEFKSLKLSLKRVDNILLQEQALYSDALRVAGRVDCIAEFDGVMSIIDFKTSTTSKNTFMIQDYYLQTTAYAIMCQEMYDIQIDNIAIIMSVERGLPLVFKQKVEDHIPALCERVNKYYTMMGNKK